MELTDLTEAELDAVTGGASLSVSPGASISGINVSVGVDLILATTPTMGSGSLGIFTTNGTTGTGYEEIFESA